MKRTGKSRRSIPPSTLKNAEVIYPRYAGLQCDKCGLLTVARETGAELPPGGQCIGCRRQLRVVFVKEAGTPKTVRRRPRRHVTTKSWRGGR